jgi:hypothetical protein
MELTFGLKDVSMDWHRKHIRCTAKLSEEATDQTVFTSDSGVVKVIQGSYMYTIELFNLFFLSSAHIQNYNVCVKIFSKMISNIYLLIRIVNFLLSSNFTHIVCQTLFLLLTSYFIDTLCNGKSQVRYPYDCEHFIVCDDKNHFNSVLEVRACDNACYDDQSQTCSPCSPSGGCPITGNSGNSVTL